MKSMDQQETGGVQFHGSLQPGPGQVEQFAARIEFNRWDASSLEVSLFLSSDKARGGSARDALHELPPRVWLHALTPDRPSVELLGLSGFSHQDNHVGLDVSAVQVGITSEVQNQERVFEVIVRLLPSGILVKPASRIRSYTGEIERRKSRMGGDVIISTPFGELNASDTYEYQTVVENGNQVTKQVQGATLMGQLLAPPGTSLEALHQEFLNAVRETCTALSLCYRQKVTFYEIVYLEIGEGLRRKSFMRRRLGTSRIKIDREELVNIEGLIDGGLERLKSKIATLPEADTLNRAISFLAASSGASVETAYFMAFSSLEAIVNSCLGDERTVAMPARKWKKFEARLRQAVDEVSTELQVPVEVIKEKLPELRRLSFRVRVLAACQLLKPKVGDIWRGRPFADGIKRATDARNGLFHTAEASEGYSMHDDLVRIRILAERLILRMIDWPDDKVWSLHDQELKIINRGLPEI